MLELPLVFFYDAASSLMSRVGGDMSSRTIQNNQRVFGRGTNLTLPNGGKFDTNHITMLNYLEVPIYDNDLFLVLKPVHLICWPKLLCQLVWNPNW